MIVTKEIGAEKLADLIKHIQAGNEVLLTQGDKPIARLVPALQPASATGVSFHVRSVKGHQVLTPSLSQDELAEEMFNWQ